MPVAAGDRSTALASVAVARPVAAPSVVQQAVAPSGTCPGAAYTAGSDRPGSPPCRAAVGSRASRRRVRADAGVAALAVLDAADQRSLSESPHAVRRPT